MIEVKIAIDEKTTADEIKKTAERGGWLISQLRDRIESELVRQVKGTDLQPLVKEYLEE